MSPAADEDGLEVELDDDEDWEDEDDEDWEDWMGEGDHSTQEEKKDD